MLQTLYDSFIWKYHPMYEKYKEMNSNDSILFCMLYEMMLHAIDELLEHNLSSIYTTNCFMTKFNIDKFELDLIATRIEETL